MITIPSKGGNYHDARQWAEISRFALKWPLRGADLWHLATAKSLQEQLPELLLLTFDEKLATAARGEGLSNQ